MNALGAVVVRVIAGETVTFRPRGDSMTPHIRSGQLVTVTPLAVPIEEGQIVLCRVHGTLRLHLVSAVDNARRRAQISNAHGHVNGWTSFERVYGVVTRVA